MAFDNLYYKRTAGTAKPCFVCYKPSTVVLATSGTIDFLYTCPTHLSDSGFATLVVEEKTSGTVSAEEIARVKFEWEEKQKVKRAEKEKEKDFGTKDNKNAEQQTADQSKKEAPPMSPNTTPSAPAAHERYILDRRIFTMRKADHRGRKQAMQAKELGPRLPSAPRGINLNIK